MRVLVTGGAGFIGSAVCRHFIANTDVEIINIDKLTYAANLNSLASVSESERYQFVKGDICDGALLDEVFQKYEPDAVMHLAAESHVDRSITGSADFIQTNIVGTYTLLEAARRWWQGLSGSRQEDFRFLHVSTDEVYGSLGSEGLFSETTAYSPNSPYASSKASADHLVNAWHHTYGLPVLITNCSNNYGPYHFPEKLIPLVILNAMEEKPLPVYGKGDNVRDWLYVEDHARALELVLRQGAPGEKYNIGGRNERTNLEVVHAICDYLDEKMPAATVERRRDLIAFVADRPGHDQRYAIDATKLVDELNWNAQENFETGLRKTIDWYLANEDWWRPLRSAVYGGERLGLLAGDKKSKEPESFGRPVDTRPILIVGRHGQVAQALDTRGFDGTSHIALGSNVVDLTNFDSVVRAFEAYNPRLVVNAAAYTAVDKAENERDLAFAVNSRGVLGLAKLCAAAKIPLIHISTDYVFDGKKSVPYVEDDPVAPLNVYGASKTEGENAIREVLREHVILRTSWVCSSTGSNFVRTMMRLAESRDELRVVDDQRGAPTFATDIADAICVISKHLLNGDGAYGTYHLAGSGETTWCGFAREIFTQSAAFGMKSPDVIAIPTCDYPTPAERPMNSRLNCKKIKDVYGISLPDWRISLGQCLNELLKKADLENAS